MAVQGKIWANNNLLNLSRCSCSEAENTNNSKCFFYFSNTFIQIEKRNSSTIFILELHIIIFLQVIFQLVVNKWLY